MDTEQRPHLEIPASPLFLEPAVDFIESCAKKLGIQRERTEQLRGASHEALTGVMENNALGKSDEKIGINVFESHGKLIVEVQNRGVPIFINPCSEYSRRLDKISVENQGRLGQTLVLEMRLPHEVAASGPLPSEISVAPEDIVIRRLEAGEETALSRLFYFVYGYHYINEFIYYPEKIAEMLRSGQLISFVASLRSGRLLGHVGLMKWSESPPVYEACLGVVDPTVKSRGLFGKLFTRTMECVQETPMQYCFFDFVTNHDLTQRFVAGFGSVDLALFVGCQTKDLQAKLEKLGLGPDPKETNRYSLLLSCKPRVEHPFKKTLRLPENMGELLGFLLKPLNLGWTPTSRFEQLESVGNYRAHFQPAQNAVVFDLQRPGRLAVAKILDEWRELLKAGYQYAAVEVPLNTAGIGNIYDTLLENGFFIAGFIPYHHSDVLGFRFQSIGPTKLAFDEIRVHTENAKKLLNIIRTQYEHLN